jgi:hypothetical protein
MVAERVILILNLRFQFKSVVMYNFSSFNWLFLPLQTTGTPLPKETSKKHCIREQYFDIDFCYFTQNTHPKGCVHKTQSGQTLPRTLRKRELRTPGCPLHKTKLLYYKNQIMSEVMG